MPKIKPIEGKYLRSKKAEANSPEYFIRYDTGGNNQNSIQGVVIKAFDAKECLKTLGKEVAYFTLLRFEKN